MRDICNAISKYEKSFCEVYQVGLNEAMVLCSLSEKPLSAGDIAELTGMTPSHTSKVISVVEKSAYVKRVLGDRDRRQMYFELMPSGAQLLERIAENSIPIPDMLKSLFEK